MNLSTQSNNNDSTSEYEDDFQNQSSFLSPPFLPATDQRRRKLFEWDWSRYWSKACVLDSKSCYGCNLVSRACRKVRTAGTMCRVWGRDWVRLQTLWCYWMKDRKYEDDQNIRLPRQSKKYIKQEKLRTTTESMLSCSLFYPLGVKSTRKQNW